MYTPVKVEKTDSSIDRANDQVYQAVNLVFKQIKELQTECNSNGKIFSNIFLLESFL